MTTVSRSVPDTPIVVLEGSPRDRGRIHGETLRAKIHELVEIWKDELGRDLAGSPDRYMDELVAGTAFEPAIERWTPGLLEEVRGLAEGAAVDFTTMYAFQLLDEDWWFRRNLKLGVRLPTPDKCSALGVAGQDGLPTFVGQNMDLPNFVAGYQAVLRITDRAVDMDAFVFTYAGLIATTGMNSSGVAACMNTLIQLDQCLDGLPVAYIVRGLLERTSFEDAVRFLKTVRHASGQNYTIGGPTNVAAFECSANKVVPFAPYEGARWVCHTNHPIVNDDQGVYTTQVVPGTPQESISSSLRNSTARFAAVRDRLERAPAIGPDLVKAALTSHDDADSPVCRHVRSDSGNFTAWSVLYELSDAPGVEFTVGPPCQSAYRTLRFDTGVAPRS